MVALEWTMGVSLDYYTKKIYYRKHALQRAIISLLT
jgi:hypothetical protein